jgi:hypothetical protein
MAKKNLKYLSVSEINEEILNSEEPKSRIRNAIISIKQQQLFILAVSVSIIIIIFSVGYIAVNYRNAGMISQSVANLQNENPISCLDDTGVLPIKHSNINIEVINATGRAGLAKAVSDELLLRDFLVTVGQVATGSTSSKSKITTIEYEKSNLAAALTLGANFLAVIYIEKPDGTYVINPDLLDGDTGSDSSGASGSSGSSDSDADASGADSGASGSADASGASSADSDDASEEGDSRDNDSDDDSDEHTDGAADTATESAGDKFAANSKIILTIGKSFYNFVPKDEVITNHTYIPLQNITGCIAK